MDFSVIVPAYNAGATLGECLTALDAQTVARDRYEVIVVDDGSSDDTSEIAARHGARVLRQSNHGQAAARNHGASEARGDILLFTDADCAPSPAWLSAMTCPFAGAAICGSKGAYRTRQRSLAARFAQIEYEERYERMLRSRFIDFVDTYAAAYCRATFLDNGGFDVSFPGDSSGEDQEFSFRLSERGYKMVFVPDAIVYHRHPATIAAYYRRKYKTGYWKALVLHLHPQKAVRDTHTPESLKAQMAIVALALPLVLLGGVLGVLWPSILLTALLLAAAFAPFTATAWRKDREVGIVAPFMLTLRALALGTGLVRGLWDAWRHAGRLAARPSAHQRVDSSHD